MKVLESAGLHLVEISGQHFIMGDEHLAKLKANVRKKLNAQRRQSGTLKTTAKTTNQKRMKNVDYSDKGYAPDPPRMKWNERGEPDYSHLDQASYSLNLNKREIPEEQLKVPDPPRMRWHERGKPDYSHLEQ